MNQREMRGFLYEWEIGSRSGPELELDDKGSRKSFAKKKWLVLGVLLGFLAAFVGLQMWCAGEFQKGISSIEQEVQKLGERLELLENTAGERNILAFLDDVESLKNECQRKMQTTAEFKRRWCFVLPFLKKETVSQRLSNLQQQLSEIAAVRPTVEAFVRRLKKTDTNIAGVIEAIGAEDAGSMIVELASFKEDSEVLRKDIERTKWPSALVPFKEIFLAALDERDAALDALLSALASAGKANDYAEQAVGTYITAWTIWDYQQMLDYLEASEEYKSQAEGYMVEFEFHTARYLKIRDRLIEGSTSEDESTKRSKV